MFGFFFGTACLLGLVAVVARGRRHRYHRFGYGRHGGFGPRGAVNAVLSRLDTGPGQEKVIQQAVDDFVAHARESGREVRGTRRDIAEAVRGDRVDEARLNEVFDRHDAALSGLRAAGVETMRKIHEALDERQRKILADLVESGPHYGFYGRGYAC